MYLPRVKASSSEGLEAAARERLPGSQGVSSHQDSTGLAFTTNPFLLPFGMTFAVFTEELKFSPVMETKP